MTDVLNMTNTVELSNGTVIPMPRLTNKKVISLGKFAAGDGLIIYSKFMNWRDEHTEKTPIMEEDGTQKKDEQGRPLFNFKFPSTEDTVEFLLENLPDEMIAKIVGILVDKTPDEAEQMDFFDTTIIIGAFFENAPIDKLQALVKKIQTKFRPVAQENVQKAQASASTNNVTPLTPLSTL